MTLRELTPWRWGGLRRFESEDRPLMDFRRDWESLHRDMDRLFEGFFRDPERMSLFSEPLGFGEVTPRIDLVEDEKSFFFYVELPGMDRKDVDISLAEGMLTIRGEKKQEKEEKGKDFFRQERAFGSFRRTVRIPGEVDDAKIEASFEKGVLKIKLPKTEAALKKVRHIDVKAA